jgi:MFS family permease
MENHSKNVLLKSIPFSIWALSISVLLMSLSSSIIFTIAPHYLVDVLKLSKQAVGWMEGIVESIAMIVRIVSGSLSDLIFKRKLVILWGYGLSTIAKAWIPFSFSVGSLYVARSFERLGNGLQAAPRDALVGDLAPQELRGSCYGIRNGMGKAGSSLGAFIVFFVLHFALKNTIGVSVDTYQLIFFLGIVPSLAAFVTLLLFVKDAPPTYSHPPSMSFRIKDILKFSHRFWLIMLVAVVFNFSHFSETFLQLRAREIGVSVAFAPLVMVVMNLAIALFAYPIGKMSDHFGRRRILMMGFVFVIVSDILLALGDGYWIVFLAIIFWGIQLAITQGMIATMVSDTVATDHRGSAFGVLNVLVGIVYLVTSPLYGWIWDSFGGIWPFMSSAVISFLSIFLLFFVTKETHPTKS